MADLGRVAGFRAVVLGSFPETRARVAGVRAVAILKWPLTAPTPAADTAPTNLKGRTKVSVSVGLDPGISGAVSGLRMNVIETNDLLLGCDRVWNKQAQSIALSATDSYDLRGGLVDVYENDIQIGTLKYAAVVNTGTTSLSVGPAASAGITQLWAATSDRTIVKPGGHWVWTSDYGLAVSGGADTISVANLSGSTAGEYEIMFIGEKP